MFSFIQCSMFCEPFQHKTHTQAYQWIFRIHFYILLFFTILVKRMRTHFAKLREIKNRFFDKGFCSKLYSNCAVGMPQHETGETIGEVVKSSVSSGGASPWCWPFLCPTWWWVAFFILLKYGMFISWLATVFFWHLRLINFPSSLSFISVHFRLVF